MTARLRAGPVRPDFAAVAATGELERVVGALLTVALITAVAMVVVCAAVWALTAHTGNWSTAARARTGVLVALAGAGLTGAALAWTNWLLDTGARL
ncbi:DUF6112 family protein [Georgenia sp. AZ-5]|uniref:DUF6112 family protein n=1 Tax=Georgenia sp. AZ-5 TaxID=3367526 RepID=UPI003755340F